jgi:CheY-like chemotaxis protein
MVEGKRGARNLFYDALEVHLCDLIFMDLMMHEMDGIETTKETRRRWPKGGPKIIAVTAYALHGGKEKCIEAGMDGYISKPVKKEELAKVLVKYRQEAHKSFRRCI